MTRKKTRLEERAEKAGPLPEGPLVVPLPDPLPELTKPPGTVQTPDDTTEEFFEKLHLFERPVTHVTTLTQGAIYAIDSQWQDRLERLAEAQRIDPVMLLERLLHRAWTSMPSAKRGP